MSVARQRAISIINAMPEVEVERFVTMNVRFEPKAERRKKVPLKEGWKAFERMRGQVQAAGVPEMTLEEMNAEIAEVRGGKRAGEITAK